MSTLIIRTNAAHGTDVLIKDMGVVIPSDHTTPGTTDIETFTDLFNVARAKGSSDLLILAIDDAYGDDSSTLILNDGNSDVAQADVESFVDGPQLDASGLVPVDQVPPNALNQFSRGYGLFQSNASFIGVNATSYAAVTDFIFPGTTALVGKSLVPTMTKFIMLSTKVSNVSLRIIDLTNAVTIVEKSVAVTMSQSISIATITGALSAGAAVWEVSIKKDTNGDGAAQLAFVSVQ